MKESCSTDNFVEVNPSKILLEPFIVLKVEADEIVADTFVHGVEVDDVLLKDGGHSFRKKENNITASKKVLEFLDRHFKAEAPSVQ